MRNVLKVIPMLLITALLVLFWIDDFAGVMVAALFFWLFIPALIAAVYFMIKSRRLSNVSQKILFGLGIFNILFLITYCAVRVPMQRCDAETMAKHYEKHGEEMELLASYLDKALDDSACVHLEFENGKASIFHVSAKGDSLLSQHWDDAETKKDSLMNVVGLTLEEYHEIRNRLKDVGCIGITMYKPHLNEGVEINFRRIGMGMYSYILYNRPLTQEEKDHYMNNAMYIPYSEKTIFLYGGGAFGSQHFPDKEKEKFLRTHKPW